MPGSVPSVAMETSASPLRRLINEDDEPVPSKGDLMPSKRRPIDIGSGVTRAVDSMAGDFSLRETATIVTGDDVEAKSRSPRLEAAKVGMPSMVAEVDI